MRPLRFCIECLPMKDDPNRFNAPHFATEELPSRLEALGLSRADICALAGINETTLLRMGSKERNRTASAMHLHQALLEAEDNPEAARKKIAAIRAEQKQGRAAR